MTPADFSALLKKVQDRPEAELIQSVLLRAQSMAVYHPENQGHFGLALDAYAHFTSPIRRYPDLLVHRAIRYALTKGKPSDYTYSEAQMAAMAVHCSQRERRAEEAERDVDERFKCAWMEKHVGEEFAGTITGVTSFGLFVELAASRVSGLVHVSQLPNDYYKFDPVRHLLAGERTGASYRLGDYVSVQVMRASLEDRKIDFRLVARLQSLPKPVAPAPVATPPPAPGNAVTEAGKAIGRAVRKMAEKLGAKRKPKAGVAAAPVVRDDARPVVDATPVAPKRVAPTRPAVAPVAKKAVAKKAAAKKTVAPSAPVKAAAKKTVAKPVVTKQAVAKKSAPTKASTPKAAVKKVATKKTATKKVAAKKAAPGKPRSKS